MTSEVVPYAEVIGDPIVQSKSPVMHRAWLEALDLAGDYRRTLVTAGELDGYLRERRADPNWRGCNVTIPHKQAVMPLLDRVDPVAAEIGAVNTVVNEGGVLIGHNTDAPGFLEPMRPWLAQRHLLRTARIFGTGGAARAVAHALWNEGFTLVIAGRDLAKAEALAAAFDRADVHVSTLDTFARPLDFDWGEPGDRLDVVVNATSLGMTGKPPLEIDFSNVPPGAIVYDAVYAPLETPLLREARRRGHPAIDGLNMLIGQGRIAFRHFFGAEPPTGPDQETVLRALLTA
ncbi:shikimate dehydrogenase [uncultured Sphingomonas sp.]|uniref:shikimate dehydrogenase n=1 Tax=uncultured Sphingomonas sp. TaxID=158754 RepID=UPI0025F26754|nr:shikimate dehydrogenase [uncultured Sphingomonas sp.]